LQRRESIEAAGLNEISETFDELSGIAGRHRKFNVEAALNVRKARLQFHATFYDMGFPTVMAQSSALKHTSRTRRWRGVV
jgi:hypothetical protein